MISRNIPPVGQKLTKHRSLFNDYIDRMIELFGARAGDEAFAG